MNRDPKTVTERAIGIGALVVAGARARWSSTTTGSTSILTQTLIVGIAAASLIFLAAYGGMISLAQTTLMGIAGFMLGNMVTSAAPAASRRGSRSGWDPTLALVLALVGTTLLGLLFGALAARSTGIYFLMITLTYSVIGFYFVGQVTVVSRLLAGSRASTSTRRRSSATSSTTATASTTSRSGSRSSSTPLIRLRRSARRSGSRCRGSATSRCG